MCPLIYDPVPKYETQHRTFSQTQTHTATEANTSTHSRHPLKINSLPPAATARSFSHAFHHACLPPDDTCIAEHHFRNKFMFVITTTTTTTFTAPKEHRHLGTGARGYIEPKIDAHPQPPVEWRCRKIAISSGSTSGRNRGTATRSWPTVLAQGFEVFRQNSQRPSFTSVRRLVSTPGRSNENARYQLARRMNDETALFGLLSHILVLRPCSCCTSSLPVFVSGRRARAFQLAVWEP